MTKKLTTIKSVYHQTQPHITEYKSEWEYLRGNYLFIKDMQNLWPSVTTFKNILSNKKKILEYLANIFSIKTTWLKYTKTLI